MKNIKKLFAEAGIANVDSIEKIEVGFANDVYCVDGEYILKVSQEKQYNAAIELDIHYCRLFEGHFSAPKVLYSGELDGKACFIYKKIKGDNLYDVWHLCTEKQRKSYIKQICGILRSINGFTCDDLGDSWQRFVHARAMEGIELAREKGVLDEKLVDNLKSYFESNKGVLEVEKMVLLDWDLHFDNFLVADGQIVGRLDFERIETASLDYQMVLVKRMVRNPKKYASEHAEQFVEVGDYAKLMDWYQEFYPEMFDFPEIEKRLNLYAVWMCLDDVEIFGGNEELVKEIEEYLG